MFFVIPERSHTCHPRILLSPITEFGDGYGFTQHFLTAWPTLKGYARSRRPPGWASHGKTFGRIIGKLVHHLADT